MPSPLLAQENEGERAKREREEEEEERRRIGKEKLELLYLFDFLDLDEKRKKQRRSERSHPEARELVVNENPLRVIWVVQREIQRIADFRVTWHLLPSLEAVGWFRREKMDFPS